MTHSGLFWLYTHNIVAIINWGLYYLSQKSLSLFILTYVILPTIQKILNIYHPSVYYESNHPLRMKELVNTLQFNLEYPLLLCDPHREIEMQYKTIYVMCMTMRLL
jgi:hypothetical protein